VRFKDHRYIGDPINAVKIFNDMSADELVILDIDASKEKRVISSELVRKIGDEANMPFAVGGGIRDLNSIKTLIGSGAEKIVLNTIAVERPVFVRESSQEFGSSTIVISIDVKKDFFGNERVYICGGQKKADYSPLKFAEKMESLGAGELIVNSIECDGMMNGYDIELIRNISENVSIPVIALGGAGNYNDLKKAVKSGFASASAAGSLFVYHGPRKAVLINYPSQNELKEIFC
jgi:cyclase